MGKRVGKMIVKVIRNILKIWF